jgi:hypothetical protein
MSWNIKGSVVLTVYFIHAEFKWDDVKVDKHRENYLGHSVKAPVGRWQKGKCYPLILPFYVSTVPVVFSYCTLLGGILKCGMLLLCYKHQINFLVQLSLGM